jgi:hypothetical protein
MPDGLGLEEGGEPVQAGLRGPVGLSIRCPQGPLEVLCGLHFQGLTLIWVAGYPGEVECVDVHVRRQRWRDLVVPVRTLTTPPGTSDVPRTSASVTAGSGRAWDATTTAVFPLTIAGASTETRPSSDDVCGANRATTPVASGTEKSKYGPATGLLEPVTCAILSAQPAYQTQRSIASSTDARLPAGSHLHQRRPVDELGTPPFHHLGDAVQDLPAVVRGSP